MIFRRLKSSLRRFYDGRYYKSKIYNVSSAEDSQLKSIYCSDRPFEERVYCLVEYFVSSWIKSSSEDYTRAYFDGAFSYNARDVDAIEGTTRFLPFIASVLMNPNYQKLTLLSEKNIPLEEMFMLSIVNGTDPNSTGYWGEVSDYSQLICEGADVALAVWIARERIITKLSAEQKSYLLIWLKKCASKKTVDNNWHLFRQTILSVLSSISSEESIDNSSYERIKDFYVGDGWFSDGVGKNFDFYNAWAFHYSLFWLSRIDEGLDSKFITSANFQFCLKYQKIFTLRGFPLFGRSQCYRMAASAPLIASMVLNNSAVEKGTIKRIFDQTWKFFILNGGVVKGVPTQGYLNQDLRFLDEYSGPASSLWGLRSLILVLQINSDDEFFKIPENPLAIEVSDYEELVDSINMKIVGNKSTGTVDIKWLDREVQPNFIEPYSWKLKFKEFLSQRPQRPKNHIIKNKLKEYTSEYPFIKDKN
ncbi:DUF2264 domain-containing protein [Alteromonas sp. BZK5]|uniref:DUF2264 domain-containing protein n=1 Tax=Alteromonas sp. BZK5 TaxID=1904459 RepID=UPI0016534BCB|nr:DUF2264 domain-containing protein [Alteromonas sp. BZK5]MBC6986307.1 DUF2264 domain-containing protein [Alteromonas sp. BZK5]